MDRAWLKALLAEKWSLHQIADLLGKHPSTVAYWIKKHGLEAAHAEKYAPRGGLEGLLAESSG